MAKASPCKIATSHENFEKKKKKKNRAASPPPWNPFPNTFFFCPHPEKNLDTILQLETIAKLQRKGKEATRKKGFYSFLLCQLSFVRLSTLKSGRQLQNWSCKPPPPPPPPP